MDIGKELFARVINQVSKRPGLFVAGDDFDPDINLTPEINIKQSDVTIEDGIGEYNFGLKIADYEEGHTSDYTSFTIENIGNTPTLKENSLKMKAFATSLGGIRK